MNLIAVSTKMLRDRRRAWLRVFYEEVAPLQLRFVLIRLFLSLLPDFVGARLRAQALRWSGFRIGSGVVMADVPTLIGLPAFHKKLVIGSHTFVNARCLFDLSDRVVIGQRVSIGPQVMLLTSTHEISESYRRAGALKLSPIRIGDGVWLGARAMVLPGVIVGDGAIVAAGAVVTKDVPPNTLVAGVPARAIRHLEHDELSFPTSTEMKSGNWSY